MSQRPSPESTELTRPYWQAAAEERLVMPKCGACGHVSFPPRQWCPECFSGDLQWVEASGRATLLSFSKVYLDPFDGYADTLPYVLAVVQLEEGPQLMSNIVDCDPERIAIGDPLRVLFERRGEGAVPQFTPA